VNERPKFAGDDCIKFHAKSDHVNCRLHLPGFPSCTSDPIMMLRLTADVCSLQLARSIARRPVTLRCLHSKSVVGAEGNDEELADVRQWLANLRADTIPRNICSISFSRSSGPGGQNVNK
jgi:hypothetical protein